MSHCSKRQYPARMIAPSARLIPGHEAPRRTRRHGQHPRHHPPPPATPARDHLHQPRSPSFAGTPRRQDPLTYTPKAVGRSAASGPGHSRPRPRTACSRRLAKGRLRGWGPTAAAASDRGTCAMARERWDSAAISSLARVPDRSSSLQCRPEAGPLADPALAPAPFAGRAQGPRSPVPLSHPARRGPPPPRLPSSQDGCSSPKTR
jgi:hypothetical protein